MKLYSFSSVKNSKELLDKTNEDGFSMLEAIVATAALLALSVSGFVSYETVVGSAKYAKVKSAASTVYSAVMVYDLDGNPFTVPQDAINQYNSSNTAIKVYLKDPASEPLVGAMTAGARTSENVFENSKYCVMAERVDDTRIAAYTGNCPQTPENGNGGTNPVGDPNPGGGGGGTAPETTDPGGGGTTPETTNPNPTPPPVNPPPTPVVPPPAPVEPPPAPDTTTTIVRYQCSSTIVSRLPFENTQTGAVVKLIPMNTGIPTIIGKTSGDDSYIVTLHAGEKYMATINGSFGALSHEISTFRGCVTSIDRIGADSGITTLSYLGVGNFPVPDNIPSSVTSIKSAFEGAKEFDNNSVSYWNTSNIQNMDSVFKGAEKFNQPLSSWNTSKVTNMQFMFSGAKLFNQSISNWNTGLVRYMQNMFDGASVFNQPLTGWNTGRVEDMTRMFASATAFNQNISTWNVGAVKNMKTMFHTATAFNQPLNTWDVDHVTDMTMMFYKASAFNQPLSGWEPEDVTNMNSMFAQATAFNQDISGWSVGSVRYWSGFKSPTLTIANTPLKFR